MIFERIVVDNLFSYAGRQELDLRGAEPGRNVCLVMGRNGFGKTSLLNSVKLLFTGSTDERARTVGIPPRKPPLNQFVGGDGADWSGILNRSTGRPGGSVSIVWREGTNRVTATRRWTREGNDYRERLEIEEEGGGRLVEEEAQSRLDHLCPREFVSFFFFDAEQIQELADAGTEDRAREIDRLLRLSFLDGVREQLSTLLTEYRRVDLEPTVRRDIANQDALIIRLTAEQEDTARRLSDADRDIADARSSLEAKEKRREGLRTGGSLFEKKRLDDAIADLRDRIDEEQRALADELPVLVPLLANPGLVERGLATLNDLITDRLSSGAQTVERLKDQLPGALLETPPFPSPRLTKEQIAHLKDRLRRYLDVFVPSADSTGVNLSIGASEAEEVRGQLVELAGGGARQRADIARRLRDLSRSKSRLRDLQRQQVDLEVQSDEERQRYARLTTEIEDGRAALEALVGDRRELALKHERDRKALDEARIERARLERRIDPAVEADRRISLTRKSLDLLSEWKSRRRAAARERIESALNAHFSALMTSHSLVHRIALNDDYGFVYLDRDGGQVGRLSVSHGMRQLAATAFLWALKEVSGKALPVMVDTPLARIDRGNQDNLLKRYYPDVAEQVILLATDSEMTAEKFDLIRPRIYRRYRLDNPSGQDCRIIENPALFGSP